MDREELGKDDFEVLDWALSQYLLTDLSSLTRMRATLLRDRLRLAHTAWLEFEERINADA